MEREKEWQCSQDDLCKVLDPMRRMQNGDAFMQRPGDRLMSRRATLGRPSGPPATCCFGDGIVGVYAAGSAKDSETSSTSNRPSGYSYNVV